jgi:signal transduction histidine kinase/ActR/RegA family two-component response regulator
MGEPARGTADQRLLVIAPIGRDAALTCALLEKAGIACHPCQTITELCQRFEEEGAGALLIAEECLVPAAFRQLRSSLAKQPAWSDIPIVIFTGTPATAGTRTPLPNQYSSLGNVTLLERPLRPIIVISAARSALRARSRQYDARAELFEQQRAVKQRDQFLAMLGHELRNPLSAILLALNLEGDRAQAKYREIVGRQVRHLTRLVDDLLDVSRVTSGKITLKREPMDLAALTQRCVASLLPQVQREETTLRYRGPEQPLLVHADPVRLEQVITNLITNARKYAARGTIDVLVAEHDGEALLEVRDTGVGIAPEMLGRVFELFTQVEGTLDRAKGGMGIGLTLVRSLVELHGGTVSAESSGIGSGSVFTVRLPRFHESERAAVSLPSDRERTSESRGARQYSILVVEDNPDSRELLITLLEARGHHVLSAADGTSGVEAALEHRPDVLLIDIGLPLLDGYGVAQRVRAALGGEPYMIAVTGYGQPDDRRRALAAGFDLHLTKPLDIARLDVLLSAEELRQPAVRLAT